MISFTSFEHESCSRVLNLVCSFPKRCLGQPERSDLSELERTKSTHKD